MKCNNCGAENSNSARYCVACGSEIYQSQYIPGHSQNSIDPVYEINERSGYADENSVPLPKKSNAGKVLAIVIAVMSLLLVGIGVGGYFAFRSGLIEINPDFDKQEEIPVKQVQEFILNTPIYTAGPVEISLCDKRIRESVEPSKVTSGYLTPLRDEENSKYFYIVVEVKNISEINIDFSNIFIECSLLSDKKYNMSDFVDVYYESSDGAELLTNSTIKPNEIKRVYLVCSVPDKLFKNYSSFDMNFGFDSKLSSKPLTKGMEACDYIFRFNAGK